MKIDANDNEEIQNIINKNLKDLENNPLPENIKETRKIFKNLEIIKIITNEYNEKDDISEEKEKINKIEFEIDKILKINSENSISNKEKSTNFIYTKKSPSKNNKKKIDNYLCDYLSLSDIDIESDLISFNFKKFISKIQTKNSMDYNIENLINLDSGNEEIFYYDNSNKIKSRIFLEKNKITVFNFSTNFTLRNAKFFPILNLDFDFLTIDLIMDLKNLKFRICILGNDKEFKFHIPNEDFFLKVSNKIYLILQNSNGYKNNLISICLRNDFFRVIFFLKINFFLSIIT